jgi:alpha-glucosidase
MLQEDDGLTFAALSGACYRTAFTVARAGHTVLLQATVTGDGFPEFARQRFALVLHGAAPDAVRVDGTAVDGTDGRFSFANAGTGFTVEFTA